MRQKNAIMSLSESCIPPPHLCGGMLPSQLQLNRTGFLLRSAKGESGANPGESVTVKFGLFLFFIKQSISIFKYR